MAASGGGPKRLTKTRGGESSPCWSPDGSEIVYSSDQGGRPQIYVISSAGGTPRSLTSSGYNTEPDWSLENGLIAYSSMRGSSFAVCQIAPNGGGSSVLYSDGSCEDPSWAPNGRHLVFSRASGGQSDLYILDTMTKEAIQLSRNFGNCTQPSWSGK
jgi:TolB protein